VLDETDQLISKIRADLHNTHLPNGKGTDHEQLVTPLPLCGNTESS